MKPLKLEIEGLRSYRKAQTIEFEPSGLLAITGATGAGKSSLLEAMMFALYGVYSGNSKSNKELIGDRCDEMRVAFEFEVQGQVYTARRAVGRKGAGSFALLKGEELICHDGNRMTAEVTQLLGLDEEQFKKTVFLPQGAFQSFLNSKPKERVELLKRLLQFEALDDLESKLQQWLGETRQIVDRAEGYRARLPADPKVQVQEAAVQLQKSQAEEVQRQLRYQSLTQVHQLLQQAAQTDQSLQSRLRILAGFHALRDFDAQAWEQARISLQERLEQSEASVNECELQLQQWKESQPEVGEEELRAFGLRHQELKQTARDVQRQEAELEAGRTKLVAVEEQRALLRAQSAPLVAQASAIEQGLQAQQSRVDEIRQQQAEWQRVSEHHQNWLRRRQQLEGEVQKHQGLLAAARELFEQWEARLQQAREAWRQDELWRVCGQHQAGQECPVCTQILPAEWKAPAPIQGPALEEVEATWQEAQATHQRLQARLEANQSQLQQWISQEPVVPAAVDPKVAEELAAQLQQQQKELAQLRQQLHRGEGEEKALEREARHLQAAAEQLQKQLQGKRQQLERLAENLPDEADLGQLEKAFAHWNSQGVSLREKHLEVRSRLQELQACWQKEVEQPEQQMGFLRQQCCQALGLEPGLELAPLLEQLQQQENELAEQLASSQQQRENWQSQWTQGLSEVGVQDVGHLERWLRQAQDQVSRAQQALELAQQQVAEVAQLELALKPARVHVDRLQSLARMLGHQRTKGTKMTFPQWFLQQRQGELLELASQHLEQLSAGQFRFEIVLEDAQSFRVLDLFSGIPRAVTTLSGGETFLASLSLALALAELVGRRGGQLQALFLDEGFGTLSAECLDRALSALEILAAQDRLIAIISHVPLIAERVEHVWVVRKTLHGSEILRASEEMRREMVRQELAIFDPRLHPLFG